MAKIPQRTRETTPLHVVDAPARNGRQVRHIKACTRMTSTSHWMATLPQQPRTTAEILAERKKAALGVIQRIH